MRPSYCRHYRKGRIRRSIPCSSFGFTTISAPEEPDGDVRDDRACLDVQSRQISPICPREAVEDVGRRTDGQRIIQADWKLRHYLVRRPVYLCDPSFHRDVAHARYGIDSNSSEVAAGGQRDISYHRIRGDIYDDHRRSFQEIDPVCVRIDSDSRRRTGDRDVRCLDARDRDRLTCSLWAVETTVVVKFFSRVEFETTVCRDVSVTRSVEVDKEVTVR